jgi:hypothetical protein
MFRTISYFVLFANQKVELKPLKKFGSVVAVLLWLAAFLVLSAGIFVLCTGRHPMGMRHHKMGYSMEKSSSTYSGRCCKGYRCQMSMEEPEGEKED